MSNSEAIMWAVEKDPALRSDFCNLTILDGRPDPERLRAKIAHALDVFERLRQRVVSPPLRLVPPEWVDDPALDLDYHLRHVALPEPGTSRQLLDLTAALAEAPLDRSRPLWEFTLVEGLEHGRAALLQKVHHTITDGVGGLRLSLSLLDLEADPPEAPEAEAGAPARPAPRTTPAGVVRAAVTDAVARRAGLARRALGGAAHVARHPFELPGRAAETARVADSLRRQLLVTEPARSPLLTGRSPGRRFDACTFSLSAARDAAARLGGSVNDLFVTAVAGALGAYHDRMGKPCGELRMAMPVNLRGRGDRGANRFAPSRVLVPTGPKDPAARFEAVRARLAGAKGEPALAVSEELAAAVSGLPTALLVSFTRSQVRTIDFATSNLRGSPVPLFLAGRRIEASYPFGPRTGCALNVTLLSLADDMHVGCNLDPAAVTDPAMFVACLEESFGELLGLAGT